MNRSSIIALHIFIGALIGAVAVPSFPSVFQSLMNIVSGGTHGAPGFVETVLGILGAIFVNLLFLPFGLLGYSVIDSPLWLMTLCGGTWGMVVGFVLALRKRQKPS